MQNLPRSLGVLLLAALGLSACGGSSSDNNSTPPPASPQRGDLGSTSVVATLSPSDLLTLLAGSDLGKIFLQLAYTPKCTITVYHMDYTTVDGTGALTDASGALMVPGGTDAACTGGRPIVVYAHGTNTDSSFDISNINDSGNGEGVLLAAVFAAEGYIVVAPNYVGYDVSKSKFHPYLVADQQSKDMIDSVIAARAALPTAAVPGSTDGGKLFVTGYSQGGHVAMATHAAMQAANMTVTASAPMSGPYALSAFGDAIFEGEVNDSAAENLGLLIPAYQNTYGDVWSTPADVIAAPYAGEIVGLLPGTASVSDLESQGKFPPAAFDSTPPSAAYAIYTPATTPANLAPVFAAGFGTDYLINNTYRGSYIADALAHPDGGFPTITDGLPPASPQVALRVHLKTNDLRNWTPTAPMLLCGGGSDPTSFFFNTTLMQNYWMTHVPPVAPVILDVDSSATSGDPYATLKAGFAAAEATLRASAILSGATDNGDAAVFSAYHATLVPPFCLTAVKSFFDTH